MAISKACGPLGALAVLALLPLTGAPAQEVSVPSVTVANPGGYANPLKLDTDRYDREQRKTKAAGACSADALPAVDRRRMEAEYVRRARSDGKASADAWVREQGQRFHQKLVAEGICPSPTDGSKTAANDRGKTDEDGCRMVMRPVAGLGGAPMTMSMVPECRDD